MMDGLEPARQRRNHAHGRRQRPTRCVCWPVEQGAVGLLSVAQSNEPLWCKGLAFGRIHAGNGTGVALKLFGGGGNRGTSCVATSSAGHSRSVERGITEYWRPATPTFLPRLSSSPAVANSRHIAMYREPPATVRISGRTKFSTPPATENLNNMNRQPTPWRSRGGTKPWRGSKYRPWEYGRAHHPQQATADGITIAPAKPGPGIESSAARHHRPGHLLLRRCCGQRQQTGFPSSPGVTDSTIYNNIIKNNEAGRHLHRLRPMRAE